jgi:glucosamine--fructose-6-phosphate aminotransferase (isomerizing)
MCGIIGYIGLRQAVPILLNGLRRMEYRGYDSAGLAVLNHGDIHITKVSGKIANLAHKLKGVSIEGEVGLGHTRWATHGEPNETNAHPHTDCSGKIAIIHNGIIENYYTIKTELASKGHVFRTQTDSEVLAHLIEELYDGDIERAVNLALSHIQGTYGLAVMSFDEPDKLIAARMGSPLVLGVGQDENFIASDLSAIVDHTRNVIFLDDGEMAVIKQNKITNTTQNRR